MNTGGLMLPESTPDSSVRLQQRGAYQQV
jgi:hypothetical protein